VSWTSRLRLSCRPLGDFELKGAGRAMALMALDWLDRSRFPVAVLVRETGERIELPLQDIVSFGRMDIIEGMSANDVVLSLPDGLATRQISRWHFELRRPATATLLRSVTTHPTLVDGRCCSAATRCHRAGQRGQPVGRDDARLRGRHAAGRHPQRRDDGDR
jgi:hypothetical protein